MILKGFSQNIDESGIKSKIKLNFRSQNPIDNVVNDKKMEINHIIFFSDRHGSEANELVESGLVEGSARAHPGQGTVNRKFYFRDFFLRLFG